MVSVELYRRSLRDLPEAHPVSYLRMQPSFAVVLSHPTSFSMLTCEVSVPSRRRIMPGLMPILFIMRCGVFVVVPACCAAGRQNYERTQYVGLCSCR